MSTQIPDPKGLFCEPGQEAWSPARFSKVLGVGERELSAVLGVHHNVMRLHPENIRVQNKLGMLADVFGQLLEIRPDLMAAAFHFKNTPIALLNHRTLIEVIAENEEDKALRYLQSISDGQAG